MKRRAYTVAAVSLLVVAAMSIAHAQGAFSRLDPWASAYLTKDRDDALVRILVMATELASPILLSALVFGLGAVLVLEKKHRTALLLFLSSGFGLALFSVLKLLFRAARPEEGLVAEASYSFPSGHATMATVFFAFLWKTYDSISPKMPYRALFAVLCAAMLLSVSLSRVYLGVHWMSDVFAGIALGTFSLSLSEALLQGKRKHS